MSQHAVIIKKKAGKSVFKRINAWLHLWLGLASGLVVFIVSVTGCIYCFEKEIRSVTQTYQFVEKQDKPFLLPSQLTAIARTHAFGNLPDTGENRIKSIQYGDAGKAAVARYQTVKDDQVMVYMNPYTGEVLKQKILERDFFRIVFDGHFYLWLPKDIGNPMIATSVLIFVVMIITGFIMWLPKNMKKANVDKSFKIKWTAKFKRLNYDLHNVLGFYVITLALVLSLTGLVWGFEWFSKSVYFVTSGGRSMPAKEKHFSDTTRASIAANAPMIDKLWLQLRPASTNIQGSLQIQLPMKTNDVFSVNYNPDEGVYYRRQFSKYDQYTLEKLKINGIYGKNFDEASGADKLNRMNYDIHVGAIAGLPGKIIMFFASFICASLPVTGFIVWWGKRNTKKNKAAKATGTNAVKKLKKMEPALEGVG